MYKTITAAALLLASATAFAGPYAGLGYQAGVSHVEDGDLRDPLIDGQLIPSDDKWSGSPRLLAGFQFNDNWALEFSFARPGLEDGVETRLDATQDEEWELDIDASQFALAPVYLRPLGKLATLRVTAGLLYGDYDIRRTHDIDVEDGADVRVSRSKDSDSAVGGLAGIGAAFHLPWKIDLVTEAQYQRTRVLSNTVFSAMAVYRF